MVTSGAKQKNETWEAGPEEGTVKYLEEEEKKKLAEDPFYKLEYQQEDKKKAEERAPVLDKLIELKDDLSRDDYANNFLLRKGFRAQKKEIQQREKEAEQKGLFIPLLPISTTDIEEARKIEFKTQSWDAQKHKLDEDRLKRKMYVKAGSIFGDKRDGPKQIVVDILQKKRKMDLEAKKECSQPKISFLPIS